MHVKIALTQKNQLTAPLQPAFQLQPAFNMDQIYQNVNNTAKYRSDYSNQLDYQFRDIH